MKTNPNEPIKTHMGAWNDEKGHTFSGRGLTKREYFAAMIYQGMSAIPDGIMQRKMSAEMAVECADALIAELNKELK